MLEVGLLLDIDTGRGCDPEYILKLFVCVLGGGSSPYYCSLLYEVHPLKTARKCQLVQNTAAILIVGDGEKEHINSILQDDFNMLQNCIYVLDT